MPKSRTGLLVIGSVLVASAAWTLRDSARTPVLPEALEAQHSLSSAVAPREARTISVIQPDSTEPVEIPGFAAAIGKLGAFPASEDREAARTNTLSAWAEADPRAAFLYLTRHGSGQADAYLSRIFFRQWAGRDFTAAFDHAERLPAGNTREELLGALALLVARTSPAEAATMTEQDMQPGAVRTEVAISILHQWALADLERASAWAAAFPQGPERQRALQEIDGIAAGAATSTTYVGLP